MTNDIGIEIGLPMDLSFGYEVPYYSENQYHVLNMKPHLLLGGKSWITLALFYLRVNVFFEVIGAKQTLSARAYFDVINKDRYCYAVDWDFETLVFKINVQVDVKECELGALAIFFPGSVSECSWKNNYLGHTFYSYDALDSNYHRTGSVIDTTCQQL
jgi:hypothetical protein